MAKFSVKGLFKSSANINKVAQNEQLKTAALLLGFVGIGVGFYFYSSSPAHKTKAVEHHLSGAFDDDLGLSYDHAGLRLLSDKIEKTNTQVAKIEKQRQFALANQAPQLDAQTAKQLEALQKELKSLKQQVADQARIRKTVHKLNTTSNTDAFESAPSRQASYGKASQKPANPMPMLNSIGIDDVVITYPEEKAKAEERNSKNYIWAGTFATGYLETGIIGDAGVNSTKNKGTVLIRITSIGTMPNGRRSHLKNCVVLGSTYGDLSSDSDVIHLETLSCASKKYSFEKKVYGSVFDLDAMQDLRGIPVLKASPILGYAAAAGMLSGLGKGISDSGTTTSVTGAGVVQTPTSVGKSAFGQGAQNAGDKISDYLMKIADIYHPIVVAHAGRKVTVLFQAGFWIDKKHQDFESMKSIGDGKDKKVQDTSSSVISTAQQQVLQGMNEVKPSPLTQQVAAASGQVHAIAEQQAQGDFNQNEIKLGQSLFTPVNKG
ncbi:TrbI/VirB10 family protein [Piscirickettsia salmonis]|uniref:TrbI/VirB10 family protein n=1 Tax=Piscirickettsia salmonis TaxID=1238 RepID=UPI0006BCC869|nr:TrbI/VirB10 family protein [Piscirickettsia salmonis]ALA26636.1 conjugal transfer protein TraB [Piscirickettsia salmonis]APS45849.1 hypothetical protein AVI48_15565 [Piscirickettsia salmonis]APS49268.1 hypothetical protein AVI49_16560 [Piscirickettsia salmonis]QGO82345.1 conjugal transfer pilus assembly protein TraB [Piscirickettsia salmonis]QGP24174.1 conjugal transfer pilus assembly protein TraB [Piscirickettsia salmonis]